MANCNNSMERSCGSRPMQRPASSCQGSMPQKQMAPCPMGNKACVSRKPASIENKPCSAKNPDPIGFMPLAMAYVPWQQFHDVYEPDKALQYGTIFPELNKPFYGKGGCMR